MGYKFIFLLIYFLTRVSLATTNSIYTSGDLISAAQDCDVSLIQNILRQQDINIDTHIWGKTPLMFAAMCESPKSARVLVEKGAQLNLMSWSKGGPDPAKSAIMYAVDCEYCLDTLNYLISVRSDLNLSSNYTALTWAMSLARFPQATLLIKSGADVNLVADGSMSEHHLCSQLI